MKNADNKQNQPPQLPFHDSQCTKPCCKYPLYKRLCCAEPHVHSKELNSEETVKAITNLLKSTRCSANNQTSEVDITILHSIFTICARLTTHHTQSIPALVSHGIIDLGKQLLTQHGNDKTSGNILLAFSNIAKDPNYRRLLSDDTLLPNLLSTFSSSITLELTCNISQRLHPAGQASFLRMQQSALQDCLKILKP